MVDIILGVVIALILTLAITYIIKEKKAGAKCIGCASSKSCSSSEKSNCGGCNGGCQHTKE